MIQTVQEPVTADVIVVGGGLAGLVAAATAARSPSHPTVVVVEPHPLGGRGRADHRDGYVLNRGPRALYRGGPAFRVLEGLGAPIGAGAAPTMTHAAARLEGRLHPFPTGARSAARTSLLTARQKARAVSAMVGPSVGIGAPRDGESVAAWLDRRSLDGGPRLLVEALVRLATYCNAPEELDARAALAAVRQAMIRGVRYLDGGWQSVVDHLTASAPDSVVWSRRRVRAVRCDGGGSIQVELDGGHRIQAPAVVLAVGSPHAAAALLGERPTDWEAAPTRAEVACLELGLRRPPRHHFVLGIDEPTYFSVHGPPARLAPDGRAVAHAMVYLRAGGPSTTPDHHGLLRGVAAAAGVAEEDIETERFLATKTVMAAIPLASSGGSDGRPPVAVGTRPGVYVAGDWVGPDGLLLDAALASARDAGQRAASRSATMVRT